MRTALSKGSAILGFPFPEEGSTAGCRNTVNHLKNQKWIKTKKKKKKKEE
jgi:hypothetical protein